MHYINNYQGQEITTLDKGPSGLGSTEDFKVKYFKIPPDILTFRCDSYAILCLAESS